ncbi:cell wall hydrolase [Sphingomonas sp. H39-1-10]|uniref:cell wall hydrolase n=1 Tax=Sphingomonas pollutisoli TaxID=3030829 RepID=UPI0023B8B286|nr:cell wall hydrolase [Sphingomonas pollutisoli]MDF0487764.1 cell wall hydrolase [Sphingomonas pollutisoli]
MFNWTSNISFNDSEELMQARLAKCASMFFWASWVLAGPSVATLPVQAQERGLVPVEDHERALECLTLAVAYEAGYESQEGQQAVAEVVLNRVRNPAFPKTVCDVVFAGSTRRTGCQFTFTCDGSLYRRLPDRILSAARIVAEDALAGRAPSRVPGATNYHADYVHPYWASSLNLVRKIGAHIFYQPQGGNSISLPGGVPLANLTNSDERGSATSKLEKTSAPQVFAPWGLATPPASLSRP